MDSKGDFLTSFYQWLSNLDEAYLIGIANRGLYNRAQKDLDQVDSPEIIEGEEEITCRLSEGVVVTLTRELGKAKCTCPSRTICKHVLMALLYLKQNLNTEVPVNSEYLQVGDFSSLLSLSKQELLKLSGNKTWKDILFRLDFGVEPVITEAGVLSIDFPEEYITVRFPEYDPIGGALCTCKLKELCRHKAESIVHYQLAKGTLSLEELRQEYEVLLPVEALQDIKQLVEEILSLGLSRLPETMSEKLEQMAVICHGLELAELEKLFRRIKSELDLYFQKNAGFVRDILRNQLVRLYCIVLSLEARGANPDLLGEYKSSYSDIPPVEIYGMGAEAWSAKSGYEGITCYFFSNKLRSWLSYTSSRPIFYDEKAVNLRRMYKAGAPWNIAGTYAELSKSCIRLVSGKLNNACRISASEQSQGTLVKLTNLADLELDGFLFADWGELLDQVALGAGYTLNTRQENSDLFILKPATWGNSNYDSVKQALNFPVYDLQGRGLLLSASYSPHNRYLIEKLESLEKNNQLPQMLLARVYMAEEALKATPLTGYYGDGKIINFSLD